MQLLALSGQLDPRDVDLGGAPIRIPPLIAENPVLDVEPLTGELRSFLFSEKSCAERVGVFFNEVSAVRWHQ